MRIAFVTIGQTPRTDIVPEMVGEITAGLPDGSVDAVEFGVLDGLEGEALDSMRAASGEPSFATRLRDGTEMVSSVARTEARLNNVLAEVDRAGFDAAVVLCTGTHIEPLRNTLVVEAQRVVDGTVEALAGSARRLGIMLPLQRQVDGFAARHAFAKDARVVAASPYAGDDLSDRARGLADCDLIVMHCMGYTGAMHEAVRRAVPAPVLLSRRVVAGVVRQML